MSPILKDRNAMIGLEGDDVLFSDGRRLSLSHLNCIKQWYCSQLYLKRGRFGMVIGSGQDIDHVADMVYRFAQYVNTGRMLPHLWRRDGAQ